MTPERWRQINALFEQALALPAAERAAFVARGGQGDEELQRRVAAMLAADAQAEFKVEQVAQDALAELLSAPVAETQASHESESLNGQLIGSYRLQRELGRGGMGRVYLAHDERLDRQVALKLLPAHLTNEADRVARFEREARVASALNHPNILTIYDFGAQAGRHYIAAEFVAGRTVRALIGQQRCTLAQALDIACQTSGALAAAHQAGIIHRDIKPENLMLRPDGFVKVLDFGLAKLTEAKARDWQDLLKTSDGESGGKGEGETGRAGEWATKPGMVMGTVAYMSPEQARGGELDARSDLFSLGVVLYEMLTGERPFKGANSIEVLTALLQQEPPPLPGDVLAENCAAQTRAELQRLVSRALAKAPAERFQSAQALHDALKQLRQELEFSAKRQGEAAASAVTAVMPAPALPKTILAQLQSWAAGQWRGGGWLGARAAIKSVAVLPFANVGDDPQMEYLPDGITEYLINSLSQLPGLRVTARGTVFTYKGRALDPRQLGVALDVRALVLGRVARRGEQLVIGVELVDVRDGACLWGAEYARPRADIFAVQEEVAREIARQLRLKLTRAAEQQLARRYTADVEAYHLYLKGRYHFLRFNRVDQERALAYFQQVVARDPRYALAYTGIADVYADCSSQYMPASEAMPRAKEAALQALALDAQLAEAHHSLAVVKWFGDWDWAGAEAAFRRALELNQNAATTHGFYADFLLRLRRFDEALSAARRCQELDPLASHGSIMVSKAFYYLGRYEESEAQCRQTLILDPHYFWAHVYLAHNFKRQGRRAAAIAELQRALAITRHDGTLAHLCCLYAAEGQHEEARAALDELEAQARQRHVSPVHRAQAYAGLGEAEPAFELLRQAYAERADHLLSLDINPFFDSLRADPRFEALRRDIGLATPSEPRPVPAAESQARPTARWRVWLAGQSFRQLRQLELLVTLTILFTLAVLGVGRYLLPARTPAPIATLAVLPFANALNDPQLEYLPDGITDSLIGSLSQLPALTVMARGTVFTYKGKEVDPRAVGAALKVNALVLGRVARAAGEQLTISVELVDAATGARLWGRDYQPVPNGLVRARDELTRELGEVLRPRLSRAERQFAKPATADNEAWQLYLRGEHLSNQGRLEAYQKALEYFNQAVARDPRFALAHAGIADVYSALSAQVLPPSEAMHRARQAALTALQLDETLPEAHNSLALVKWWADWDWDGAEREFQRAIELNPNLSRAHFTYTGLLIQRGRFDDALREIGRAEALDPFSLRVIELAGRRLIYARQPEQAVAHLRKSLELYPDSATLRLTLGLALSQLGRHQEAVGAARQAAGLNSAPTYRAWLAYCLARAGQRAEALSLLHDLQRRATHERVSPAYIARIYVGLGENELALQWLRKSYDEHSDHILGVGADPVYDPLRADPRFQEMLRGIGLAQ